MPMSSHIANSIKGLNFNLEVFKELEWEAETRIRLINESIGILDEIILDPVFNFTLQFAHQIKVTDTEVIKAVLAGGEPLLEFLEKEEFLLNSEGLNEEYIKLVIRETKTILESGLKGMIPPEEVFKALVRLKFRLIEVKEKKVKKGWGSAARKLSLGLGGGVLIYINASGLAVTLGMFGPLSALSAAVGGSLIGEGMKAAYDALSVEA